MARRKAAAPAASHANGDRDVSPSGKTRVQGFKSTSPEIQQTRAIAGIIIGERHRKDIGDIDGLAASMAELGLLQAIGVQPDGLLIWGERRLHAAKLLGWTEIPVNVVDLDSVVRGEFAENAHRKDFTLSEAVAIRRALEPIEREAAKERQGARTDKRPENFSTSSSGRALDKVATVIGKHRTTIAKAEAIVDAAEAEPEKFGKLLADMDRTGRANGVYRRLKITKQAEQIRAEPPPLPGNGPYRVIVCDVAWPYEKRDSDPSHRAALPYLTTSIADICKLPVASITAPDCILWFWVTNHHMREAYEILDAWGFEQKTILTWVKDRFGTGDWLRGQTEHCLMCVRGKPIVELTNQTTVLHAPVRGHSVKPVEFYELVESLCPAPRYADLFSRYRHNDKWDCHGDEAPPAGETWDAMWARPFNYTKLDGGAMKHVPRREFENGIHPLEAWLARAGALDILVREGEVNPVFALDELIPPLLVMLGLEGGHD
jgi:N6-adenosine-specific RNA methylase IME4